MRHTTDLPAAPFSKAAIICAFLLSLLLGTVALLLEDSVLVFVSSAMVMVLIVMAGGLRSRTTDWFEPINIVGYSLLFSVGLRSVYMMTVSSDRRDFIALGLSHQDILGHVPLIIASIGSLVLGYHAVRRFRFAERAVSVMSRREVVRSRLVAVVLALFVLSLAGLLIYWSQVGIRFDGDVLGLSRKRSARTGEGFSVNGYSRLLAQVGQFGFFLIFAALMSRSLRPTAAARGLMLATLASGLVLPFLASSRSTIVILGIVPLIIAYYYGRLRVRWLIGLFIVGVFLITAMGQIRSINQTGDAAYDSSIDAVLGSGNGLDLFRTSAIIEATDERHVSLGGESYTAFFTAPVPRAIWPDKPDTSLGPWVKSELFGFNVRTNGMPPGLIAEGYLNFGVAGSLISSFLFGALLRVFYESFRSHLGRSFVPTLIYSVSVWRLAFGTIGVNFAQGLIQTLTLLVPITLLAVLVTRARPTDLHGPESAVISRMAVP